MDNSIGNLIKTGRICYEQGLNSAHSGNISFLAADSGLVYISASGAMLGHLADDDILAVSLDSGAPQDASPRKKPSRELPVHLSIYHRVANAGAVVHIHSLAAIILSGFYQQIIPEDAEGLFYLPVIPVREFANPIGSPELAGGVAESLAVSKAMIVKNHGIFAVGSDLGEALLYAQCVDSVCRLIKGRREFACL